MRLIITMGFLSVGLTYTSDIGAGHPTGVGEFRVRERTGNLVLITL
jgi:hypothetical protein